MKKAIQHIFSICMAFLVMFSTVSFTVDKHYCGDFLVDLAVFSEAKSCGMEMNANSSMGEDHCCSNQKIAVDGQDELKHSFESLSLDQQLFISNFTFTYLNLFENLPEQVVPFKHYSPPILVYDIQLEDQVFLI